MDCLVGGNSGCTICVGQRTFNCTLDLCYPEEFALDCCLQTNCTGSPPPCVACDAEEIALRSCINTEEFWTYCHAAWELCFPPP